MFAELRLLNLEVEKEEEGNRRNDRKDSGDEITFIPEFFPSFVFFAL